jgi:hypothetical protein
MRDEVARRTLGEREYGKILALTADVGRAGLNVTPTSAFGFRSANDGLETGDNASAPGTVFMATNRFACILVKTFKKPDFWLLEETRLRSDAEVHFACGSFHWLTASFH